MIHTNGKSLYTTYVPVTHHYPDRWRISIKSIEKNDDGDYDTADYYTTEEVYNSCEVGDMFSYDENRDCERELAAILKSYGYEDSRRGQQYCGSNGDADVVGLPGIHIECKRVEKLNIYDAVEQSKNDARTGEMPVVMHRKNRKEWLVTMPLDDWMKLYEKMVEEVQNA